MSSTLCLNPQMQSVGEWVKIFPRQVTETYTSSASFMKQLTLIAVSTISYLKNLFPQDNYTTEHFAGVRVQILKNNSEDELAQFLSTSIMQAFEAFDKKYLHQMAICFYEHCDDESTERNLIEYHIFEYAYQSEGTFMNVRAKTQNNIERSAKYSFDNVKERTANVIRACVVLAEINGEEMPDLFDVSVRLYYNKDAPKGYQAPGFYQPAEDRDHVQSTRHKTIKLGRVETPFHSITPRTYVKENNISSDGVPSSIENLTPMSLSDDDFIVSTQNSALTSSANRPLNIQCPCNKLDCGDVLLTCHVCNTQQHAACFGVIRSRVALLQQHCCTACSDVDPSRQPTDPLLVSLSATKRECMCVVRRTLSWCARTRSVSAGALMDKFSLPPRDAAKLLFILHSHGIVHRGPHEDLTFADPVNREQLKRVMGLFFPSGEQDVDSYLAQFSSSTRSKSSLLEPSSSKQDYEDNTGAQDIVIRNVSSLAVDGSNVSADEGSHSQSRKRSNMFVGTGARTKRARGPQ